ncbi:MAG: Zn-ribbon domain-containing OB-fold protein [Pseudomonadales bacterium]|nr:Zn-ribbon domain-containing OB-fold protein [Pseudomonadales bacterium]
MSKKQKVPVPRINEETKPFWDATADRKFMLKLCGDCDQHHFYPRSKCPHCHSLNTTWVQASGKGKIYTHSTLRRAKVPFTLAYVTLDEGVSVLTNIVDCDPDTLSIDQRVEVVFRDNGEGSAMPYFKPAQT